MKVELIVAVALTSLSIGERQQRSTVLTDESKRILDHFDFSNFDKQEALNYIDRQRYENQIRGKRSHSKSKKDQNEKAQDMTDARAELSKDGGGQSDEAGLDLASAADGRGSASTDDGWHCERVVGGIRTRSALAGRTKRGRHSRRKHRLKSGLLKCEDDSDDEQCDRNDKNRHRKRKRKKKKKRHYWDRWSDWTPCSVTCGRGRKIRWRKCIARHCMYGEFEMGEKTCQLPACNLLSKLLGL